MKGLQRLLAVLAILLATNTVALAAYPLQVRDVAGRLVRIAAPPQRIYVQNGNTMTALALLEREDPFARLAGWNNSLGDSDPSLWRLMQQRWPHATQLPLLPFDSAGHVDLEALLRLRPDLVLLSLESRPAVEGGRIAALLAALHIPILYVDSSRNPVAHLPAMLQMLGQVLGREAEAQAYLDFYQARLNAIQQVAATAPRPPRVFVEIRAGRLGLAQCCFSQGNTAWGYLIEAVGGRNIAKQLLPGMTGDIALETLIGLQPDVYLMTGTQRQRKGARTIPFGYDISVSEAEQAMARLMQRKGLALATAAAGGCVQALYHQFYDSAFHIAALEHLAKMLYPDRLAALDPDQTYRDVLKRFTTLPDAEFVFHISRNHAGEPC